MENSPEIRFPEFRDSWSKSKLGKLLQVTTGNKDTKDKEPEGSFPFFVRSDNVERINSYSYDGEAILTSGDGVGVGKNFHYINGRFDYHQRVYCLYEFSDEVEGKFIYHFFSKAFYKRVMRLSAKNSVDSVRMDMITEMPIRLPSLEEQQKIADFLSSVDQKIQQLMRKKELLEEYKKGIMQKLFSQEIRFKDENGEDFPDWETIKLQEVAEVNPRSGGLPESFIYIDLESVEDGRLLKEEEITLSEAPSRAQRLLEPGDILFQTVRPYQMNNYLFDKEGNYVASSGYAQIKAKQNRYFLFYLLHYQPIVNLVIRWSTGSSFPAISANDLVDLPLPFPSEKEQQKIADVLNLLSTKIHTIESKIEKFQTFKKGLLQQMFV